MRRTPITTSILFLAALSVDVFAVGNIGTPTAELKARQWSIGADYAYSDMDLDTSEMKYTDSTPSSGKTPFDFPKIETNFYYATLKYGLTDNLEVYGRLGIADIKGKDRFPDYSNQWEGGNFDNDAVWGLGIRYTFCQQDKVCWGVTTNMNWIDTSESWTSGGDKKVDIDLSAYDLLVAAGPTVDMGGWKLYGGPFFYMIDGDVEDKEITTADGGTWWKGKADVEEDCAFGGYIGTTIALRANTDVTFEVAAISGGWAAGGGAGVKF